MAELVELVKKNDIKGVERLIKSGCDLNVYDDGYTALITACIEGHKNMVIKLIEAGCNLDLKGPQDHSALSITYYFNRYEIIPILIEAGCDINTQNVFGHTPLTLNIINSNDSEPVLNLIEKGCDLNIQSEYGPTALMYSLRENKAKIIFKLIEVGCDLNLQDKQGRTYEDYLTEKMVPVVKSALKARKLYNNLFGVCIKYVNKNKQKFKKDNLLSLNRDIRHYLDLC